MHKLQYIYNYLKNEMEMDNAFTSEMIEDTRRTADMAYWRLSRAERRQINRYV